MSFCGNVTLILRTGSHVLYISPCTRLSFTYGLELSHHKSKTNNLRTTSKTYAFFPIKMTAQVYYY